MKKIIYLIPFIIIALASCESPKEKKIKQIQKLEVNDSMFSPKRLEDLKVAYLDFAGKYPDDERSPDYLSKASQVCMALGQSDYAIQLLQTVIDQYPKSKKSEEALFRQGYLYENNLQNLVKAKNAYQEFLKKYPNSELAKDAKFSLENLGKSPEELFNVITNKKDSAS
ncbi:MAG: tol-pal system YbgF family protein [Bacteroidia bacterium]